MCSPWTISANTKLSKDIPQGGPVQRGRINVLQFYWRDPPPVDGKQVNVTFNPEAWRYYYSQIIHAIVDTDERVAMQMSVGTFVAVDGLDLEVSIYPAIARFLFRGECAGARSRLSYSSTSSTRPTRCRDRGKRRR